MADQISTEKPTGNGEEIGKVTTLDEVQPVKSGSTLPSLGNTATPEMYSKISAIYGKKAEDDNIAPATDVEYIIDRIQEMSEEEAIQILTDAIEFHSNDPSMIPRL